MSIPTYGNYIHALDDIMNVFEGYSTPELESYAKGPCIDDDPLPMEIFDKILPKIIAVRDLEKTKKISLKTKAQWQRKTLSDDT